MLLRRTSSLKTQLHSPEQRLRLAMRCAAKKAVELLISPGKILAEKPRSLLLTAAHLARHIFIAGGSGSGKSKLLELVCRQIIAQGDGFTFIDPHGDTVRSLLHWMALNGVDPSRIVYWRPGLDCSVSFDPYADVPEGLSPLEYQSWLTSTVDRIVRAILRNVALADQELMKRLKNWLSIILFVAGVNVDGRHLGLSDALILTNPDRQAFGAILERVLPHLPADYAAELQKLRDTSSSYVRDKWLESTINALRELLKGPLVRILFAQEAQSFLPREAIQKRLIVLVDLSESDTLSREQGCVVGGMLINFYISTARRIAEALRVLHFLIIDEAENYVGEDLKGSFAEMRKYRLAVCIAIQDLGCLRKGDLDLKERVIDNCALWFVFAQTEPENIEYFGKALKYGSLDLTPLLVDTVLPDGYEWVDTESLTVGLSMQQGLSLSESVTQTHSQTHQRHTADSIQKSVSLALSETDTEGTSETVSEGTSEGQGGSCSTGTTEGRSKGVSETHSAGQSRGVTASETAGHSVGRTSGQTKGISRGTTWSDSFAVSRQTSRGTSIAHSEQTSSSEADGTTKQRSSSEGKSRSDGHGKSGRLREQPTFSSSEGENRTHSSSTSDGETHTHTTGRSHGETVTSTRGTTKGETATCSDGRSKTVNEGTNSGRSETWSDGSTHGTSDTQSVQHAHGTSETMSHGSSRTDTTSWSAGNSRTLSRGSNHASSNGLTLGASIAAGTSEGSSEGESSGESQGMTRGLSAGRGASLSRGFTKTPLAKQTIVQRPSGGLVVTVENQLYAVMNQLASLPDRFVLVKCKGMASPFLMQVHEVRDPYAEQRLHACEAWREDDIRAFRDRVRSAHPFYFVPQDDDQSRRVRRFLGEDPHSVERTTVEEEENPYGT